MKRIYLDHAATTPVDPRVMAAMRPYFAEKFGNAGSTHSFGQEAIGAVDAAREIIAGALGAKFNEIIFTGSATEANNLALRGAVASFQRFSRGTAVRPLLRRPPAASRSDNADPVGGQAYRNSESFRLKIAENFMPRIVVSAIEHESVLETARELEREGAELVIVPVNRAGIVDLKKLEAALNERTAIVSVMLANNEMGAIQPIAEIAKLIADFKKQLSNPKTYKLKPNTYPLFHTDAVQAFQYLDCSSGALNADLLTVSAHKICGPKGVGVLYVKGGRRDTKLVAGGYSLTPIITGGGQEFGYRSGTENTPPIAGFGRAASLAIAAREKEIGRMVELRDYFWREFKKIFRRAEINGDLRKALPNILNVFISGHEAQFFLTKLDMLGLAASSGSACSARSLQPSYVIEALGFGARRAKNSVRFSFGRTTGQDELTEALRRMRGAFG